MGEVSWIICCFIMVLLGLDLPFSFCQRSPTISHVSQNQVARIGGVVELQCAVQDARDYPVVWTRRNFDNTDHLTISHGATLIIRDTRFSLPYHRGSHLYKLQIKDLQESDAGAYQCQILIGSNIKVTASVNVSMRVPSRISDNSTRAVVAVEGDRVKLECYARGFPKPTITWKRANYAVLPTGGAVYKGNVLVIHAVKKKDKGTYYCVADNGVGGDRRSISVAVEYSPIVTVPRGRVRQALTYAMDLRCDVEGYPSPAILWFRSNGLKLYNNQEYSISEFPMDEEYTMSNLRVNKIQRKHLGKYFCQARNKVNVSTSSVELLESPTPVCPPACHISYLGKGSSIGAATVGFVFVNVLVSLFSRSASLFT